MTVSVPNKISEAAKKRCTPEWREAVSKRQMGHKVTKETREKISKGNEGKKLTKETIQKMSKAKMGHEVSEVTREKLSKAHKGRKVSPLTRERISEALKGRTLSQNHKDRLSEVLKGENGSNWKGGISSKNHLIRASHKWKTWREVVFEKDDWTCQDCKKRGCELHPHHILPLAEHPEFAYDVDNGITLCVPCHRNRHGWKTKLNNK